MPQFSSQFAIIDKIKSIVKKTGSLFTGNSNSGITEAIAKKIQRGAYEISKQGKKDTYSQPYLTIAEQLQSNDRQICQAAVFYLADIAINEKKNSESIIEILNKYADNNELEKEQIAYVKDKIDYIKTQQRKKNKK